MAETTGERRTVRAIYRLFVWLFLATLVAQVYLAGYGFFEANFGPHAVFGYTGVHAAALLMMVLSFFARLGRNLVIWNVVTFLVAFFMPQLAVIGTSTVAALHPVMALAVFTAGIYLAYRARSFTFSASAERATTKSAA